MSNTNCAARRCRYVELLEPSDVGEAHLFTSHTWGAPFFDLVAAIAHVATDDMFVWLDIFAVRLRIPPVTRFNSYAWPDIFRPETCCS